MKKFVLAFAALCALCSVSFAKAPKVGGWKDVAKIADKNGMEVVSDYTDYYVAKGNGGKDFAIYAVVEYDDAKVTLAMSCIGGDVFSKTTSVAKGGDFPGSSFSMTEKDKKCSYQAGPSADSNITEFGIYYWTATVIHLRQENRAEACQKYGLVLPASVKKADDNFAKAYDAASDSDFDDAGALQKIINSFFVN